MGSDPHFTEEATKVRCGQVTDSCSHSQCGLWPASQTGYLMAQTQAAEYQPELNTRICSHVCSSCIAGVEAQRGEGLARSAVRGRGGGDPGAPVRSVGRAEQRAGRALHRCLPF